MAARTDKNGSAQRPILKIPPLKEIIQEGNREIGRQVREAVEKAVTEGIAVDPARLRKWGPDGADYFSKQLRERIMPAPSPVGSTAKAAASSTSDGNHRDAVRAPNPAASSRRSAPVITREKDWMHQEVNRWSIATRAIARGIVVAVGLLLLAIIIPRIWS